MSWECRHKSDDHCYKLDVPCDPGRKGCVLHGKFYFPFAPEKNPQPVKPLSPEESRKEPSEGEQEASEPG